MSIIRAIVAGERDAQALAKFRDPRCRQSEEQIAEQLSGHWREDHLFSLTQALKMHDAIEERIQAYDKEITRKPAEMEREDCRQREAPKLRNRNKAKLIQVAGTGVAQAVRSAAWDPDSECTQTCADQMIERTLREPPQRRLQRQKDPPPHAEISQNGLADLPYQRVLLCPTLLGAGDRNDFAFPVEVFQA